MITITDINDTRLDIFSKLSEPELAHYYEPDFGLFLAESEKVLERAIVAGYEPVSALVEDKMLPQVAHYFDSYPNVEVYSAPFETLKEITGYHMTGGVICAMRRRANIPVAELLKGANRIAVLENVVNPTNIGAIMRNAAGLGIDAVLLVPGCCDPLSKRAIRVSMGTVFQIPWTYFSSPEVSATGAAVARELRNYGFANIAMALEEKSVSIRNESIQAEEKVAIFLGSEGKGLLDGTIEACDYTVMIPMSHEVDSLNVAAASALAFWELGNYSNKK